MERTVAMCDMCRRVLDDVASDCRCPSLGGRAPVFEPARPCRCRCDIREYLLCRMPAVL